MIIYPVLVLDRDRLLIHDMQRPAQYSNLGLCRARQRERRIVLGGVGPCERQDVPVARKSAPSFQPWLVLEPSYAPSGVSSCFFKPRSIVAEQISGAKDALCSRNVSCFRMGKDLGNARTLRPRISPSALRGGRIWS